MSMGGDVLVNDRRRVADFVNAYVKHNGYDVVMSNQELMNLLEKNGAEPKSVFYLNSDLCYNRINDGIIDGFKEEIHLFEYVKRGYYRLLGEGYSYTGNIMHKKKNLPEYVAGKWENGYIVQWNPNVTKGVIPITENATEENDFAFVRNFPGKDNVSLVRKKDTGVLYVKKIYDNYNLEVFKRMKEANIDGVPEIVEIEEKNGKLVIIEKYIEGWTLDSIFQKNGILRPNEIEFVARGICAILKKMHSMNPPIIHRDIKPQNIIITNQLYLIDFNASREMHKGVSEDTVFAGTIGYAAPEQNGSYGSPSTQATDIYGLGATLRYLMTGVASNNVFANNKYESVLRKCLKMDPKDRYQSIEEFEKAFFGA